MADIQRWRNDRNAAQVRPRFRGRAALGVLGLCLGGLLLVTSGCSLTITPPPPAASTPSVLRPPLTKTRIIWARIRAKIRKAFQ